MNKLLANPISLTACLDIAGAWLELGGRSEIDIAALEPLLWKDGSQDVSHLILALKDKYGTPPKVNLTTNGLLLGKFSKQLKSAGVDKVRVSWPSCNPDIYRQIVGKDCYSRFFASIEQAISDGLPVQFNRVMLKGFLDDLPQQLKYISEWDSQLKLYDLYWTPAISSRFPEFYIELDEVINRHVLPNTVKTDKISNDHTRSRRIFHLKNGGKVEIKLSNDQTDPNTPCLTCQEKHHCIESFGDYLRVDPDLSAFPCYLRRDLKQRFHCSDRALLSEQLREYLTRIFSQTWESQIREMKLRLVVVPYCNYRCSLPGTGIHYCLKANGNYRFSV